jgi:hypothetical protein
MITDVIHNIQGLFNKHEPQEGHTNAFRHFDYEEIIEYEYKNHIHKLESFYLDNKIDLIIKKIEITKKKDTDFKLICNESGLEKHNDFIKLKIIKYLLRKVNYKYDKRINIVVSIDAFINNPTLFTVTIHLEKLNTIKSNMIGGNINCSQIPYLIGSNTVPTYGCPEFKWINKLF